jgi:penicillin-binding protein 1A
LNPNRDGTLSLRPPIAGIEMRKFLVIGLIGMLLSSLVPAAMAGFALWDVFLGGYDHLKKEKILEILSKETTVYYADGQNQLGSLFGSEHRHYVPLKEIPRHMLDALVAAEDDGFYSHKGVDFVSTARAVVRNVLQGRREGASTITQQTVKNLYGRPVTNLRAKYAEAINAFKIERVYSKDEILEFYLNQFHVTGNGRGLGVAAKYYFDKGTEDLTLTEAAFIAGSVKGPERYNPFTKRTAAAQAKARADAKVRKNYVLRRMLESKKLSAEQYEQAKNEEVPFRQGRFQFNELFITEIVQRQVGREEILKAIGAETVEQVASLGLRITTTLEKPVQLAAQYGVRQNLSRLEMILSGFQKENPSLFTFIQKPEKYGFYATRVESVSKEKGAEQAVLSFGVSKCVVPTDGILRVAKITDQSWYRGVEKSKALFLSQIAEGDTVLASVKEITPEGNIICDIERRPRIQGALIVLDKGQIVAMVGGYSPHEYNRAVFAKRQPGSTFKTLTYYPALQLGWNALEPLLNIRSVYTWQGQFYFPRPDHAPDTLETTFLGAGAKSENLASVYLLARMLDKLTFSQFRELLEFLEIHRDGSSETDLQKALAGRFNVKMNEGNLKGGIFESLRSDLVQDLGVSDDTRLRMILRGMNYGRGFDAESARVQATKAAALPAKEKQLRLHVLRNNFLRWSKVADSARLALTRLKTLADALEPLNSADRTMLGSFALTADGKNLAFVSNDAFKPAEISPLLANPVLKTVSPEELLAAVEAQPGLLSEENVWLDGVLPASLERELATQIASKYESIQGASTLEKLFWHDDFRYSLGMVYAQRMVHAMGVDSDIQWVPSYPLGANVVTLAELSLAYQSLLEGKTYRYFKDAGANQLTLLRRIEDAQGNLLWEAEAKEHRVADEIYSPSILSILRGTVTNGTARAAHSNVILRSKSREEDKLLQKSPIRIPTFGKTGTTNDYVNATYIGFLPYPESKGAKVLNAENAYTIAAYVGYDTNEPMRKRGFKVAGGTGALPAWIETALALVKEEGYADKLEWKNLVEKKVVEVPFDYGSNSEKITTSLHSGLVSSQGGGADAAEGSQAKEDLNAALNDYARTGNEPIFQGALPGSFSGGQFLPRTQVSFFKHEPKESTGELPPLPHGLLGGNENAKTEADKSERSTAIGAPVASQQTDKVVPEALPTEKFVEGEEWDMNFDLPPLPQELNSAEKAPAPTPAGAAP